MKEECRLAEKQSQHFSRLVEPANGIYRRALAALGNCGILFVISLWLSRQLN